MFAVVAHTTHSIDLLTVLAIALIVGGIIGLVRHAVLLGALALVVGVIILLAYSNVFG